MRANCKHLAGVREGVWAVSPELLASVKLVVEALALAVGGALGILFAIRNGWFKMQKDTVDTYKDAIEALELKVEDLEGRMRSLEDKNKELEGEVEGKDRVIEELVAAISASGLCQRAWEPCPNRIIPVDGAIKLPRRGRAKTT